MAKNSMKPQIRFKGFTDLPDRQAGAWEQRKLGDIATEMIAGGDIDKNIILEKGRYPVIANALTGDGIVGYYDCQYRVKAPAVTITGRGDIGHAKARMVDFTPVVRLLTIKSDHDVYFLENAINTLKIVIESTGVPQLTVPQLAKYELCFPRELAEETSIGLLFKNFDNLITLHQRKYEKFVNIKKALLEKMFPQDGETVPRIRFKGFTDLPAGRQVLGKWCVYVLACDDGSFYKGITNDLTGRISAHIKGRGAEHTKKHKPIKLIYCEAFETEKEAAAKERFLKSGSGREWLKQNLQTYKPFDDSRELSYDNDAWEQRKLGEISHTTIGEFVIKTKQNDNNPYPVYNGGTSYTGFYDEFNNEGNKILVSARGANAGFVNIVKSRYWAGNSCYSIELLDKTLFDMDFLYQEMKRNQSKFIDNQQAANIPSVSKADVENFDIVAPSFDEQNKIAELFAYLDNLITLHQRKVEKLKNIKSALLEKMFV